ncbi:hypothetical protein HUJ04_003156 [Dendroctonus ponderosae]|uniref:Peroxisomal ATPase PEX1 n=1 Tax=Dendroctonus ponderosae TaxID=77166 RepID=A0AAR5PT90_DENPD|nr:hypothetical protein HUJ04_003156 [Dendroctonus ponderosae]
MFDTVLSVKYVSEKNCFVYLSPKHKNVNTGMCMKMTNDSTEAFFSAKVISNIVEFDSIAINSTYAKLLGFQENELVNVSNVSQSPVVTCVIIKPLTQPDYEVLEMFSQNVQSNLLDQVRVIHSGQKLVIWIGNSLTVSVMVENVQPVSPGALDFLTEVVIEPPHNSSHVLNNCKVAEKPQILQEYISFFKSISSNEDIGPVNSETRIRDRYYRLIPLSFLPSSFKIKSNVFTGYICETVPDCDNEISNFFKMTLLNSIGEEKEMFIRLSNFVDVPVEFYNNNLGNLFVDNSVFSFLQCDFPARVVLQKIPRSPSVKEIEIHSTKSYLINLVEELKKYLADHCVPPIIINAKYPISINGRFHCFLTFSHNVKFCIVDQEFLRNCSYSVCDEFVTSLEDIVKKRETSNEMCFTIAPVKSICDNILSVLLKTGVFEVENIILSGRPGTGKSSVMENISRTLNSYPYFIKTERVYCKNIKGKTLESLHKFFTDLLSNLILSQPALLILDDLQVLCEVWEGEETPNTIFSNRVSEMLHTLFIDTQKVHAVGILASTDLVSKLNKHIYRSRGNHLYKNVFTMEDLNKADRILLLKHFLGKHLVDTSLDYEELALKTDGFVVQDIEDFYTKALFEAYKDRQEDRQTPMITQEHCLVALKKTCALSLQSITFHNGNRKSFEDIGGLHDVKNVLIESLMWPAKYPNIFSHAPLRLQSGILLYGPPGTGKTLIAGAAARQCGLRLISIKGPELLSKYIGASEQGVRDVFDKAQLGKPCILFFDEFDSLAPRRGHDNTGVTDRVVNQLLTQLDGVEALTGVCVLAATSRPDLLDPALLRPGRLDKQLICSMPNYDDRLEILNILSSKLDLAEDVKMEEIAQKTEGYSGADLQSVLFTAQISTMKDCVSTDSIEAQPLKTSHEILLQSLSQTKPSLPKSERAKYERIYKKFSGRSVETFNTGSRVTLA